MDSTNPFYKQVSLLVRLLPIIGQQPCFALKGGTALNLFVRNLPRLSVDIDLAYILTADRAQALAEIDQTLKVIADDIQRRLSGVNISAQPNTKTGTLLKLNIEQADAVVKIEVNPLLRGTVYEAEKRAVSPLVEKYFGYAKGPLLNFHDLYAGKICATLDRQHPRDLYDTSILLNNEGINRELMIAFMVYLIGHNRPMAELLAPRQQPIADIFEAEFQGMASDEVDLETLEATLPRLRNELHSHLTDDDKAFLLSFKEGKPNWAYLSIEHLEQLPSVRWKLWNLDKMDKKKRHEAIVNLEAVLYEGDDI